MSYKLRNTIILLVLTVLVLAAGGYLLFMHYPKRVERLQAEIQRIDNTVAQHPAREKYLEQINESIQDRRELLAGLEKQVERNLTVAEAFAYLDDIQDRFGSVTFALTTREHGKSKQGYGYRSFTLSGEAPFSSIFSMIWALERGPKVMKLESVSLRGVESTLPESREPTVYIPFELQIRALFADVADLPPIERTLADVDVPRRRNLFWPLIMKNLPPNRQNLLEAERAELRAILPGRAVVAEPSGKVRVLEEGDEVYLGYLTKINSQENWVEFTLNKGGIVERYVLHLPVQSQQETP